MNEQIKSQKEDMLNLSQQIKDMAEKGYVLISNEWTRLPMETGFDPKSFYVLKAPGNEIGLHLEFRIPDEGFTRQKANIRTLQNNADHYSFDEIIEMIKKACDRRNDSILLLSDYVESEDLKKLERMGYLIIPGSGINTSVTIQISWK